MNYSVLDDFELLRLFYEEDEDAFAEIYNRYWKVFFYTANNIIQNRDVAQDVVQEVFITFWQRRKEVEIQYITSTGYTIPDIQQYFYCFDKR